MAQDVTVQALRVEAFFPADAATRGALEQLLTESTLEPVGSKP